VWAHTHTLPVLSRQWSLVILGVCPLHEIQKSEPVEKSANYQL
jgi:hypothetical protein